MIKCMYCEREFQSQSALRSHHKAVHKDIHPYPPRELQQDPYEETEADRLVDRMIFGRWY